MQWRRRRFIVAPGQEGRNLRAAVFDDLKIVDPEVGNEVALLVDDRHAEIDEIDGALEDLSECGCG